MTQVLQMFGWFCFGSTSMFIMLIMLIVLLVVLLAQCQSGGLLADTGTADVWNRPVAAVEDRVAAAVPIVHGILNPPQ